MIDFPRMKCLRSPVLLLVAVVALLLPWTGWGAVGIQLVFPFLIGCLLFRLFPDRSIPWRGVLALGLLLVIAGLRIVLDAILHDGGDWTSDGEWPLVAMTVFFQLFFGQVGFAAGFLFGGGRAARV